MPNENNLLPEHAQLAAVLDNPDAMIGEYTAIVLRLIKIKKVHRVLRHTFHFLLDFHSNYKRPILSLY